TRLVLLPESVSASSPDFSTFAATADGVVKIADSVQRQRGVVGNVASTQRVTSLATSVPSLMSVPPL
ncbi:hypothetical protein, partial [Salmonella enterica]|uniref:hypothetical protein n=1 Tax=Salmonella enterica TaxID=28901 RepID=UPI0021CC59F1